MALDKDGEKLTDGTYEKRQSFVQNEKKSNLVSERDN